MNRYAMRARQRLLRYRLGLVVLVCVSTALIPRITIAQDTGDMCFQETGQCIEGRFQVYWEQNGGLAVFGFPTTAAREEVNRDTGQSYLTQWFERARFELHPDKTAPYDVLLGRLGDDVLRGQGRNWFAFPKAGPGTPHYFGETGHAIAPRFWDYWQTHGLEFDGRPGTSFAESLALFGYPLSEPQMETNSSGDTVLTQWFERARFEYHPDQPAPYTVLLGLLGNELRRGSQVITTTIAGFPVAAGQNVFWYDTRGDADSNMRVKTIYGYDLTIQTGFLVADTPASKGLLATDGQTLAWVEDYVAGTTPHERIQGYDLNTHQQFTILETRALNVLGDVALDRGVLYYTDATPGHSGLYARTVATGQERLVAARGEQPVAGDGVLLWRVTEGGGPANPPRVTLHALQVDGGAERVIATETSEAALRYTVSGDHVVWSFGPGPVYLYTISTASTTALPSAGSGIWPVIGGDRVVWAEPPRPGAGWTLVVSNLATGGRATALDAGSAQVTPVAILNQRTLTYVRASGTGGFVVYRQELP